MTIRAQYTGDLGRDVLLREGTSDNQVWADTYSGRYHLPPPDMPEPRTVLDLGANIGLTAAHYQAMWPDAQIVAVEMDEACAALIERNAPGVEVRCHAVSGEGGWGYYNQDVRAEAYTFVKGRSPDPSDITTHVAGGKIVASYTLRQTIRRSFMIPDHAPTIDFVKLDVESAEHAIFRHGSWAPLVQHLLVELHPGGPDDLPDDSAVLMADAIERLQALGFEARHHPPHPRAVYAWRP